MLPPLILALWALDLAAVGLLAAATMPALRVLLGWHPGSADRRQLRLERQLEASALQARWAFAAWALGTALWAVAVAGVLPDLVPGAMCGTGVFEAMAGRGDRALALRGLALAALGGWHLVHRLGASRPDGALAEAGARGLLLALPIVALAAWDGVTALGRLDTHSAVDCCAVVYDAVRQGDSGVLAHLTEAHWARALIGASGAVLVLALAVLARPNRAWSARALALAAPAWALIAGGALVQVLAPYRYGVLAHRCPWCLFLAEHGRVGYPLFAALLLVSMLLILPCAMSERRKCT